MPGRPRRAEQRLVVRQRQVKGGTFPTNGHDMLPVQARDATLLNPKAIINKLLNRTGLEGLKAACLAPFGKSHSQWLWHIDIRAEAEGVDGDAAPVTAVAMADQKAIGVPKILKAILAADRLARKRETAIGAGTALWRPVLSITCIPSTGPPPPTGSLRS